MGAVAIGALALSFIGVWLIFTTFKATNRAARYAGVGARQARHAAQAARETLEHMKIVSESELRPWLSVSPRLIGGISYGTTLARVYVSIEIQNVGKMVAFDVQARTSLLSGHTDVEEEIERLISAHQPEIGNTLFPNEKLSKDRPLRIPIGKVRVPLDNGIWVPVICIVATYRRSNNPAKPCLSSRAIVVMSKHNDGRETLGVTHSGGGVAGHDLCMQNWVKGNSAT